MQAGTGARVGRAAGLGAFGIVIGVVIIFQPLTPPNPAALPQRVAGPSTSPFEQA